MSILVIEHLPKTRALLNKPVPEMLHHYTMGNALIGVMSTGKLWAGRPDLMNDSTEQKYAIDLMARIVQARLTVESAITDEQKAFAENISHIDLHEICWKYLPRFTVSLTTEEDLLSQWRAYCDSSGGYCIGISGIHLRKLADEQGYQLRPCLYEFDDVATMVNELYDFSMNQFCLEVTSTNRVIEEIWTDTIKEFAMNLAVHGTLVKHESFREEKEWRLVSIAREFDHEDLTFIQGPDGVKVFQHFSINTETNPVKLADPPLRCLIGPSSRPTQSIYPVRSLMEKLVGRGNARICRTDTPLI